MRIKKIEHYDDFDDCIIFWLEVEEVDNKYKELAKEIDKENYLDNCFGICINYDTEEKDFTVVSDYYADEQLYYIDNDGNKHWFEYIVDNSVINVLKELCKNENIKIN